MTNELAVDSQPSSGFRRLDPRRVPRHLVIAGAMVLIMLGVWAALAVMYSGIGGGRSVADVQSVMRAVTSTQATSGSVTVQSVLATPEYFSVAGRGDGFFGLAPEQNLITLTRDPAAFDALDLSASALSIDPEKMLSLLLMVDVHEGFIPDPATWLPAVELSLDGVALPPVADYSTAFRSEHHLTLALQFPRVDVAGQPISTAATGTLNLAVPDFEAGSGTLDAQWALPLTFIRHRAHPSKRN